MELNNQQLNALARRIVAEIKNKAISIEKEYASSNQLQKDIDNDKLYQTLVKIFEEYEFIDMITTNIQNGGRTFSRQGLRDSFANKLIYAKQVKLPYDLFEVVRDSLILDNIDVINISAILDKIVDKYVEKYLNN